MLGEYDFYFSRVSGYYRNTKEMFADWGMAFVLYPEFTKVHSPVTTKFFLEHLDKKPEFAKTYNYIQAAINKTPGESTGREGQLFNDMFDAIKRLMATPHHYQSVRNSALATIDDHYSWDGILTPLLRLLNHDKVKSL